MTSTDGRHLRSVPKPASRKTTYRCDVASQAIMIGNQEVAVQGVAPATGRHGQIAVRVGRLLVYVGDRDALAAWLDALGQADAMADKVFGPLPRPSAYRPRRM